jgi:phosphate/sulfate permease
MRSVTRALRAFLSFWYDFIVGDDATIAVGVVVALAVTAILARSHVPAWWLLPVAVLVLLGLSLRRASRG